MWIVSGSSVAGKYLKKKKNKKSSRAERRLLGITTETNLECSLQDSAKWFNV